MKYFAEKKLNLTATLDGAYIGMRANITTRHDLVIDEGSVIGAGTLVNKSVHDGATCVGVPGKNIICWVG